MDGGRPRGSQPISIARYTGGQHGEGLEAGNRREGLRPLHFSFSLLMRIWSILPGSGAVSTYVAK